PGWKAGLCCARAGQSCCCDRCGNVQGREVSPGRPARLAAQLYTRREAPVHHQRCFQRRVGDRRGATARPALHQGRTLPLGRRGGAILIKPEEDDLAHDLAHLNAAIGLLAAGIIAFGASRAVAAEAGDWPCIQRKVATLTSAQMWDGPDVDGLTGWRD